MAILTKTLVPVAVVAMITVVVAVAAIGCGSDGGKKTAAEQPSTQNLSATPSGEFEAVVQPGRTFTIDQLVAAGWKKSKELSPATLPGSTEVWYGFYERRDIEARVYRSHDDARGPGADAAREAIGRSPNSNIGGGIITSLGNRTQYHAYVVAGNLVLLCEQTTQACLQLMQQIP